MHFCCLVKVLEITKYLQKFSAGSSTVAFVWMHAIFGWKNRSEVIKLQQTNF